jgi:hypothetical protein
VNRKVWIICELTEDFCIGTVGQILADRPLKDGLFEAVQAVVKEMVADDNFDVDSIEFTIEIRN